MAAEHKVQLQAVPIINPEPQVVPLREGAMELEPDILDFEVDTVGAMRFWPDRDGEPDHEAIQAELVVAMEAEGYRMDGKLEFQREPSMRGWYFYTYGVRLGAPVNG